MLLGSVAGTRCWLFSQLSALSFSFFRFACLEVITRHGVFRESGVRNEDVEGQLVYLEVPDVVEMRFF